VSSTKPFGDILSTIKRESIVTLLRKGERIDGRGLHEYRKIEIETNVISKAEGSALVKIGDTKVIAGVKTEIGKPFPDTPDMGVQIVNAELIPIASPFFEPGPPGEDDIELSRVIDRGLRSSEAIKLNELAPIPGEKVWIIYIDIYPLDHYGNLVDASGLAAVSALLTTKIKNWKVEDGDVVLLDEEKPLPIGEVPVFVTVGKIGDTLIVDPSYEEELILDAKITLAVTSNGKISGIQKSGLGGFTPEEIKNAVSLAINVADQVRKKLPT